MKGVAACVVGSILALGLGVALWMVGMAAIRHHPRQDICLQNDLCVVCEAPAELENAPQDFGKNYRLCEQHRTFWTRIFYGLLGVTINYYDAPLGSGPVFTIFMRGLFLIIWVVVMAFLLFLGGYLAFMALRTAHGRIEKG